jgi:hypothetical protein
MMSGSGKDRPFARNLSISQRYSHAALILERNGDRLVFSHLYGLDDLAN